jgi:hypothetical protein
VGSLRVDTRAVIVNFDALSLFTGVPVNETVDPLSRYFGEDIVWLVFLRNLLQLLVTANVSSWMIHFTLKMETIRSSEMSVLTRLTLHHNPEDGIRRENLKSCINGVLYHLQSPLLVNLLHLYMKNAVLWNVTPCGSCKNRHFGRTYRLIIRGTRIGELGTTLAVTCLPDDGGDTFL